jgi:hypothetical protein
MVGKKIKNRFLVLILSVLCSALFAFGQTPKKQKLVLIPFRPKLYLGLYDAPIHKFSKWPGPKIKFYFRKQVNTLLASALSSKYTVLDLCADTNTYKFDLTYLYNNSGTELLKVKTIQVEQPNQKRTNKTIKNGRLVNTSVNLDLYYTHTKPISNAVFKAFEKRFKADYYITINQFDMVPDDMNEVIKNENSDARAIKIHYSVFNQKGEHLFGDYAAIIFPKAENNPELISTKYMQALMKSISESILKATTSKK